jgi:hypothetical protein
MSESPNIALAGESRRQFCNSLKRRPLAPDPHPRYAAGRTKTGESLIVAGLKMGGRSDAHACSHCGCVLGSSRRFDLCSLSIADSSVTVRLNHERTAPHRDAAPIARGVMALSSLECFCLTSWIEKASCKLSQNCSEVPKYFANRAAISGVTFRFSRTISLTVGAETCSSTANL